MVRYVPWSKLRKDEDDNVIGVVGVAFALRSDEEFLSATWLEYFQGNYASQIVSCVQTVRASNLTVGKKSAFAIGCVKTVKSACQSRGKRPRIIHEPEDDNPAHAAVRNWPNDDDALLNLIAEEDCWGAYVLNSSVP